MLFLIFLTFPVSKRQKKETLPPVFMSEGVYFPVKQQSENVHPQEKKEVNDKIILLIILLHLPGHGQIHHRNRI